MPKKSLSALQRPDVATFKAQPKTPLVLVLDNVRSALNVGSAFRTADGFGIERVILCGITATPPHREIFKTAIGATESVEWRYEKSTETALESLRAADYHIVGIEQSTDSVSLADWRLATDTEYALVVGNEVSGVSDAALALCHTTVEVPQYGTKHSFNVAVCTGIVLWEAVRQLKFGA